MTLRRTSGHRTRLSVVAAFSLVLAAFLVVPSASASANPRVTPCIWPSTGTDLQQYFGISVSLVVPSCDQIKAGSPWATPSAFYVARTWEQVPAGYEPVGATPLDELESDLTMVRFIVDEGTPHQFTVQVDAPHIHFQVRDWDEVYPGDPDWLLVDIGTHITLRPLPPGVHTVRGQFALSRPACDGTSSEYIQSCIPPGVFDYPDTRTFTVVS